MGREQPRVMTCVVPVPGARRRVPTSLVLGCSLCEDSIAIRDSATPGNTCATFHKQHCPLRPSDQVNRIIKCPLEFKPAAAHHQLRPATAPQLALHSTFNPRLHPHICSVGSTAPLKSLSYTLRLRDLLASRSTIPGQPGAHFPE